MTDARATVAERGLVAEASAHLTETIAMHLDFDQLGPFKVLLKRFFSAEPWTTADDQALDELVAPAIGSGWWDHALDSDLTIHHGIRDGHYTLAVSGPPPEAASLFDRVFSGPVVPEATPHPRKVKFPIGGAPAPGTWYRQGDVVDDARVLRLLEDPDITDVMVAGDFVTVGLAKTASWEERLDDLLEKVTEYFWDPDAGPATTPERTRDELVGEGLRTAAPAQLHLLDPDDPTHRARLEGAMRHPKAEVRRVALATLAQSTDDRFAAEVLAAAYEDGHRIVRRMAIDGAADLGTEPIRPLLERGLDDEDAWTRWKAVRGLRELGVGTSRQRLRDAADDADFQVRFEVAAALRDTE